MAGKFSGLIYDPASYSEQLSRSTQPLNYRLDLNQYVNCNNCFHTNGPNPQVQNYTPMPDHIDVDSILKGIDRVNSKANKDQQLYPLKTTNPNLQVCSSNLESLNSRFSHPAHDIRGLTTSDMRFSYPLKDPQCQIFENFSVNTRLQAKDNHRTPWQEPMNQNCVLPREKREKRAMCNVRLDCSYQ